MPIIPDLLLLINGSAKPLDSNNWMDEPSNDDVNTRNEERIACSTPKYHWMHFSCNMYVQFQHASSLAGGNDRALA